MSTWYGDDPPVWPRITPRGWCLIALRGVCLLPWFLAGVVAFLLCRLVERVLKGHEPSMWVTVGVCRGALWILGLRMSVRGADLAPSAVLVANHASWLDILVLNAQGPLRFVSKSEVAEWPGIGWLARLTGTVFVRRDPRDATAQREALSRRIASGQRLLLFPEGTSSDGGRILRFKSALFGAFFIENMRKDQLVQPLGVSYTAPHGHDPRFYGWWGDMELARHLAAVLSVPRQGRVEIVRCTPIQVAANAGRKDLATAAERAIRSALEAPH